MNDTSNVGVNNTGVTQNPVPNPNPMPAGGVNPSVPAQQPVQANTGVAMPSPAVSVPQQPVAPAQPVVNTSVQPAAQPQVAPTPAQPQAAPTEAAPADSNVEIQMSSNISATAIMEEPKKESKKEKGSNKVVNDGEEESDDLINQNANRAPIMVVVIFFAFLLAAFIYYYIIMTPYKVYSKAFDNIFNGIKENIHSFKESEKNKFKLDLGFDLDTDQKVVEKYAKQLGDVDYIDNDYLEGIINIDKKTNDIKVTLRSEKRVENLKKLQLEEMIEDSSKERQEMLDFTFYMVDGQTYIGPIDYINYNNIKEFGTKKIEIPKPIKLDIFSMITGDDGGGFNTDIFDIEKVESIYTLLEMTKDKVIDLLEDKELNRSIGVARIGGTTAIALKSSAYVEKKKIEKIHQELFEDALKDKQEHANDKDFKVIDELMFITGLEREEIVEKLKELSERSSLIEKVEVNLYMNLANTELISLYVRVDEKYTFQIDYLNGYYQFHIDIVKDGKKTFVIDATYNEVDGIVDGLGYIENDNTIVGVKFDYERKLNDEGRKSGNSLKFKFYNNDTFRLEDESKREPLAILNCTMDIYDDPETTKDNSLNFNLEEEVKDAAQSLGRYSSDLNKFKTHFISHIDFLVDHLLYNKGDAAANRKKLGDNSSDVKETKTEETQTTETETKVEETNTSETTQTTTEENTGETNTTSISETTETNTNTENETPAPVE